MVQWYIYDITIEYSTKLMYHLKKICGTQKIMNPRKPNEINGLGCTTNFSICGTFGSKTEFFTKISLKNGKFFQ